MLATRKGFHAERTSSGHSWNVLDGPRYDYVVGRPANSDDLVLGVWTGTSFVEHFRFAADASLTASGRKIIDGGGCYYV